MSTWKLPPLLIATPLSRPETPSRWLMSVFIRNWCIIVAFHGCFQKTYSHYFLGGFWTWTWTKKNPDFIKFQSVFARWFIMYTASSVTGRKEKTCFIHAIIYSWSLGSQIIPVFITAVHLSLMINVQTVHKYTIKERLCVTAKATLISRIPPFGWCTNTQHISAASTFFSAAGTLVCNHHSSPQRHVFQMLPSSTATDHVTAVSQRSSLQLSLAWLASLAGL